MKLLVSALGSCDSRRSAKGWLYGMWRGGGQQQQQQQSRPRAQVRQGAR
jgi:hypothetical protein